ncbi:PREDICTED: ADP/ATP translocase 3-like [Eufriesea mexicana]|uniref:ADP/ATP translocase 3-like n=1 Tax=Eufriesea mexicana TaxID=516756 RepID=UPI00083C371A|nr:PREDICTED: ADP/ATP translocase 3-like [Eufriesea mexicana]
MAQDKRATQSDSTIDVKLLNGLDTRLRVAVDFGASFIISGILAIIFRSMIAPIERIKLILQTQASSRQIGIPERSAYSGILNALIRIPKEQGLWSLWRGNVLNICRYFPAQAINFSFYDLYYEIFQKMIQSRTVYSHIILPFLTGGAVGVTSCTILYPLNFCNTRITVDVGDNKMIKREFYSLNDCLSKVYKSDGYRGFYQGLSLSVCGLSLYRFKVIILSVAGAVRAGSIYFGAYTIGKSTYLNNYGTDPHRVNAPFLVSLALAQLASSIATVISYPLDTASKQKMLWSGRGPKNYVSIRQVINNIIEKDGPVGFYRGISANLMTAICGSFVLVTYDVIKGRFDQLIESKNTKSET